MHFINRLNATVGVISEGRQMVPAVIYMKRGTVIEVDHARMITLPRGGKMIVAGIGPGRYQLRTMHQSANFVNTMRDFYAPPYYEPAKWQYEDGTDPNGICTSCNRPYYECMADPCEYPHYKYDLHRDYIMTRLFKKILTINPKNVDRVVKL